MTPVGLRCSLSRRARTAALLTAALALGAGAAAERAVLLVGKPAVPQPRFAVDRHPPGERERVIAARLGHGQRQHGAARLAGRPALRRRPGRRARRAGQLGDQRPGGQPGQFPTTGFPTTGGRHTGLTIRTSGSTVTLTLNGDQPAGPVLFQLPAFVRNIAHASAGTVDEATGTVTLPATTRSVTVQLTSAE